MEPFVPERDDSRNQPSGTSRPSRQAPPKGGSDKAKGGFSGKPLVLVLAVVSIVLLAAVIFQQTSLSSLQAQFDDLKSKIDTTDESLNQSGAALSIRIQNQAQKVKSQGERIDTNFSEIDKLWAARKKINQNISTVETSISSLEKELSGFDAKIAAGVKSAKQAEENLKTTASKMQGDLNSLRQEMLSIKLGLDGIETQAANAVAKATSLESAINKTNSRITENEEALRAIDSFRQYMSSEITALKSNQGSTASTGYTSSGGSVTAAEISKIREEIRLLKQQHPYLSN